MSNGIDLAQLLARSSDVVRRVLDDAPRRRLQVLLTLIEPGSTTLAQPAAFRADDEYFYPASTIKTAAAYAALLRLDELSRAGHPDLSPETPMVFHPFPADRSVQDRDDSNIRGGSITIGHDCRKIALVSDNPAHNRLYEFVGHREINEITARLVRSEPGREVVINHRLAEPKIPLDSNRTTPRVEVRCEVPVQIPQRTSDLLLDSEHVPGVRVGREHVDPLTDERRAGPMDFSRRNRMSLRSLHTLLLTLTRPDLLPPPTTLTLRPAWRDMLLEAMTIPPRLSDNPRYEAREYPDHFAKYLLPGLCRRCAAADIIVTNKVGRAYGFSIENAMITHRPSGRSIAITATIYANAREVINDGGYEDESLSDPFMADLGEAIAREFF
jgi:hypothetical protein